MEKALQMEHRTADAERLKRLYEDRVPEGMSQADFGQTFGIGTQGMVSQYLTGHRPLNVEAAAKFAKGLRCTIADISPDMARRLRAEIFPVLGRVSIKAALALVLAIPPLVESARCVLCKIKAAVRFLPTSLVRLRTGAESIKAVR